MKAINVMWDIDYDQVFELLDEMTSNAASDALEIAVDKYSNMTTSEKHDYAYDYFRHCPGALDDFMGLPYEIEIPDGLTDDDDISDWLSDEYGFCHAGFDLKE